MAKEGKLPSEQLELESFKAVSGAEYARQRLLHGLSMGTPSIEDDAYLIKSRVKRVDSLIIKVLERRRGGSEDYRPANARDIVGLRLLALFKNDLPILVRRFIAFVAWSQKPPFSLFYGTTIREAIAEIKIYATSDVNDVNTDFIVEEFEVQGFTRGESNADDVCIEIHRKASQYSSIHIVLWANGPNQSVNDRIPVEVQLRTSLEDVWGEIDHRLRYKARNAPVDLQQPSSVIPATSLRELEILKKNLDTCSDFADLIGMKIKTDVATANVIRPYNKLISYDIDKLIDEKFAEELRTPLHHTVDNLHDVYRTIYDQEGPATPQTLKGLLLALGRAIDELTTYLAMKQFSKRRGWQGTEGYYRLKMEVALCYYWTAVILKALSSVEPNLPHEEGVQRAIRVALKHYRDVAKVRSNSSDSVISFRVANAIALQGEHDLALIKFADAFRDLKDDPRVAENHHFRVRIPRSYALALWESAERSKLRSLELGGEAFFELERRELYLKALDVTLGISHLKADDGDLDRYTVSGAQEERVTTNNIIEYTLCFLKANGNTAALRARGITPERLAHHLGQLIEDSVESIPTVNLADTVRELARWMGNRKLAVDAAARVLTLLQRKDFSVALPDFSYREMELDARRELDIGLQSFPGYPRQW